MNLKIRTLGIVAFALSIALSVARAQESVSVAITEPAPRSYVAPEVAERAAKAQAMLRGYHEGNAYPALSIAVATGGKLVWAEAVGFADTAKETKADLETRFRIGSTSKALTAVAAGILMEQGKLDVDRPVGKYLPAYPAKRWSFTPRQLAGHQAGVRHYAGNSEYMNQTRYESVQASLEVFKDAPLLFEPGTAYSYSTHGYTLLSAVLEAAAGKDFLSLMQQTVFAPLGMERTLPEYSDRNLESRATYYGPNPFGARSIVPSVDNSNKWAGGGFESTPSDLATFGMAVLDEQIISADTRDILFTPQTLANGEQTGKNYGLGFRRNQSTLPASGREVEIVHHGGTALGGRSFLMLIPEENMAVSLLGNYHSGREPFSEFSSMALALVEVLMDDASGRTGVQTVTEDG